MSTAQQPAKVLIRHWRSQYLVPDAHPYPEKIRGRLDDVVRDDVPGVLAAGFSRLLEGTDDEMIFVRRLQLDVAVDAGWEPHAIAAQCAQALMRHLSRELALGDSANVVRFGSRIDYLARFVVDLATGDAGSRWYYERYAGLRALPCSAAIRTALLDDAGSGLGALRRLSDDDLATVLDALGERECARVRDMLADTQGDGDAAHAFAVLVARARGATPARVATASQLALWWIARCDSSDRALVLAAHAVAATLLGLRSGTLRADIVFRAIVDEAPGALIELARCADVLLHLRACPAPLLRELVALDKTAAPATPIDALSGSSPFGGPFLLLDDLFGLPLQAATAGWPALDGVDGDRLLRFLILCRCGGGARAATMQLDPLWRYLFAIPPSIDHAAIAAWFASLGPRCRRRYRHALARSDDAGPAQVRYAGDHGGKLHRLLVDHDELWRRLERWSREPVGSVDSALGQDIDYLLSDAPALPHAWSLLLALSAQRVLRRFLRRLPGFAASHLVYARRNLLDFAANLEAQPTRIVVRLARPPLGLILNFAGCNRGARRWPALDARPFALFNTD